MIVNVILGEVMEKIQNKDYKLYSLNIEIVLDLIRQSEKVIGRKGDKP